MDARAQRVIRKLQKEQHQWEHAVTFWNPGTIERSQARNMVDAYRNAARMVKEEFKQSTNKEK
jgi:hypothetical protein